MTNQYYTATGAPVAQSRGSSATIRAESLLIQQGFDKLPDPSVFGGNAQTYAVDTGLVNALVCTVNSNVTSYYDGMELVVKVLATNTGASTIAPGTLGIKTINRSDGTALQAGDMSAGQICQFRYSTSTSSFQLVTTSIGAATSLAAAAAASANSAAASAAAAQAAEAAASANAAAAAAMQLPDYAALQAYNGTLKSVYITGYLATSAPSGIAGYFTRDDSDTTSIGNGGTIIVDAIGRRWKRIIDGAINLKWFDAKGNGVANDTLALKAATEAAGTTGDVLITKGTYKIDSSGGYNLITCGRLIFERGAVIAPAPYSEFIIDAAVDAGDAKCFDVGKLVYCCDCDAGSTALRTWVYGFEDSDAGKPVQLRYGGAVTGATPVPNFVQARLAFNTTIAAYVSDSQVTLNSGPINAIRQDYVWNAGYSYVNTGVVIVGNGTVEFTTKVPKINVKWFGATGDGSTDDAVSIGKATQSVARRYGGAEFWFPDGTYLIGREIKIDTDNCTVKSNPRKATIIRKANVALERMNNITLNWRGRYGGGGPTKGAEHWTFAGLSGSVSAPYWGGDWFIMSGFVIDGPVINGNKQNQPILVVGTGLDSWDAGLSALYVKRVLIKSTCSFVNSLRWGAALSTQSHDGVCEDGVYFDSCDEGAFYAETSNNIICGSIITNNSPAVGWNMGAITYLRISGGGIKSPISDGANNGIYLRNSCQDIDVDIGALKNCLNNAVWMMDESFGGGVLKNITIKGGSVNGSVNGIVADYVDGLTISGVKGAVTGKGIFIGHVTKFNITDSPIAGAVKDIEISSGSLRGVVANNTCNVELSGTSSAYITFDIPSGFSYTDSTTVPPGYIAVIQKNNFGDGNARHTFETGGIGLSSGLWSKYPIDFGGTVLWVDGGGKLRIKSGYPTSDTDGVVVGTQT